ncbi:MAG: hypothetical protein H6702_19770 [Myxococcales bacterium]|nr:hypothetical protein [Myxococcales bacterium]
MARTATRYVALAALAAMLVACTGATLDLNGPAADAGPAEAGTLDGGSGMDRGVGGEADRGPAPDPDGGGLPEDRGVPPDEGPAPDLAPPPPDLAPPPPDLAPPPPDMDPLPAARDCQYRSVTFGAARVEIDVGPASPERLTFRVDGLPDPALIDEAILRFDSHDADHPGEEGRIYVNGQGPYDLPADLAWDNAAGTGAVDVTGDVVAGTNRIEFGPGPLDRSYFGIANVQLTVRARVAECQAAPPPPPPDAVVREIRYPRAEYTNRRTWVVGCENNPARAYAFTAAGDEHVPTDCEGLYRAGGNRVGDAIFRFDDVVAADYDIVIRSRHTENRNPAGALFLVNGEGRRISQRSDRDVTEDTWGRRRLGGQVEVILRAEGQSDCVIAVRLEPVGG